MERALRGGKEIRTKHPRIMGWRKSNSHTRGWNYSLTKKRRKIITKYPRKTMKITRGWNYSLTKFQRRKKLTKCPRKTMKMMHEFFNVEKRKVLFPFSHVVLALCSPRAEINNGGFVINSCLFWCHVSSRQSGIIFFIFFALFS